MSESFLEEMKRYVGFTAADAAMLASLAPVVEPCIPALADRFYEQIPKHPEAAAVFTGGDAGEMTSRSDWCLFSHSHGVR